MLMTDDDHVREGLRDALDGVLLALHAHGGIGDGEVPLVALDRALRTDEPHQVARLRHRDLISELRVLLGEDHVDLVLTLEEAATDVATAGTSVGFRLGVAARPRRSS